MEMEMEKIQQAMGNQVWMHRDFNALSTDSQLYWRN